MAYPEDAGTITPLVDGTDYEEAANVNNVVTELSNVKTLVGIPGAAQSHLATILDMLADNYTGGRCYGEDGTTDEVYVSAFSGIISNAAGSIRKPRRITTVTTLTAADLDTGAMAVGYYYIYATADTAATTPVFVFSASATTPTGYTNYKRIGKFYNATASVLDILPGMVVTDGDTSFGEWTTQQNDVADGGVATYAEDLIYLAESDGFVMARAAGTAVRIMGYTDGSNPPTTLRIDNGTDIVTNNSQAGIMMPVRKGDYWEINTEVAASATIFWLPRFGA